MNELGLDSYSEWCGYIIMRKQDFPSYQKDRLGYVVTKGGCNVMPGATWFETMAGAHKGIAALELAKRIAPKPDGDGCDCDIFWMLIELSHREFILPPKENPNKDVVSLRHLLDAVSLSGAAEALRHAAAGFAIIANNTHESHVKSFASQNYRICVEAERKLATN
jgi:hypothetical protein